MLRALLVVATCLFPIPLWADEAKLLADLPERTLKKLQKPDQFIEDATGLIMGYGVQGKIDFPGIASFIASERAYARARALRGMLLADLNDDLEITEAELRVQMRAASATRRGKLLLNFRASDIDTDGTLSFKEMRQRSQQIALDALNGEKAQELLDLMQFDLDEDGFVSLEEVVSTVRSYEFEA